MRKILSVSLVFLLLSLSACGSNRDTNGPPKTETQLDSKTGNSPVTGNEDVNVENEEGIIDKDDNNDHLIEK
ncbi:hypothetical protein WAX74_00820 [Psychrobacillus sp. FJAT-51614]|uniref:Lipoprotein n=1 Tax=Psychrobacillus mangrovi TaxID=3117745 RepID=A0ABU8EZT4_9BACI